MPLLRRLINQGLENPLLLAAGGGLLLFTLIFLGIALLVNWAKNEQAARLTAAPRIIALTELHQISGNYHHPGYKDLFREPLGVTGQAAYILPDPARKRRLFLPLKPPPLRLLMNTPDPERKLECRLTSRPPYQQQRMAVLTELPTEVSIQGQFRGATPERIILSPCYLPFGS